jgi:hypothetical protein
MIEDGACSRGVKHLPSESSRHTDDCANQLLLLSQLSVVRFKDITEVSSHGFLTGCSRHSSLDFADDITFSPGICPDCLTILDIFHSKDINVNASLRHLEDEVRIIVCETFRESELAILSVEFTAVVLGCDRKTQGVRRLSAVFGRVCTYLSGTSFAVPTVERLSEFSRRSDCASAAGERKLISAISC